MLTIAGKNFNSRLLVGTGKFSSYETMRNAIHASAADIVTVALRRMDFTENTHNIMDFIDDTLQLLPNTSGAQDAEEAVRIARICRAGAQTNWIKLEVGRDPHYLLPDPIETVKAAEILVKEGFVVLPYINADPMLAKRLEEIGCATVMPLGSPIGTNQGIKTRDMIQIIIEMAHVPVVVDAGIGKPSDAMLAMEMGADAVLINTAIAAAHNPVLVAEAFREAVIWGRKAYESGLGNVSHTAVASSPLTGFLR